MAMKWDMRKVFGKSRMFVLEKYGAKIRA